MQMSQQWFIYYRIRAEDQAEVIQAVRAFQSALCERWPGLMAQVLRRADRQSELLTLMETYEFEPDRVADDPAWSAGGLPRDIEHAALTLAPWLQSARHTEEFVPCV
ncbi:MAG: hypothetical protein C4K60_18845 [Ideonella sp. MAG2]|nr:MAG: hypothetical protein C4K60_18845 [Ideonella sp. MAG2]